MKITAIETVRIEEFPNLLWVQVSTDDGLVGLGETFFGPGAVEAHIHETIAPILICLLYTSPSPRDLSTSRMPSSA